MSVGVLMGSGELVIKSDVNLSSQENARNMNNNPSNRIHWEI
jgi:hypothetical protein